MKHYAKRIFNCIFLCALMCTVLVGCSNANTSKSYTFGVDTGDKIKITMDTSDKYDMSSSLPIQFSKDVETQSQGTFAQAEAYDLYKEVVDEGNEEIELYDEGSLNGVTYIFYSTESESGTEHNYIMKFDNSNTCFLLANNISKESAEDIFNRLTFTVEETGNVETDVDTTETSEE